MASEEPEEEPVGLLAAVYQYTVFIGVLTWLLYWVWRKLRQQGLTDKLESELLVSLSQQIIKTCCVCEKLLPFHSSQQCRDCASRVCAECCIEQQCSTCYLDKSTVSLLSSPEFQSRLRVKLEAALASLDLPPAPPGGRPPAPLEVRDLMEKLVESLVEEQLDETPITPLSDHPAYKPVAPSETTGAVQTQLKSLIVQVLREANSLPPLHLNSSKGSSNVDNLKSKTYEDILATTILNKIVEKCQHSKTVTSSTEDRDASGAPLKSVNTSVKATCEFKIGPLECACGGIQDGDGEDCQDGGARTEDRERVWSKGRTSLLCTTVEHIEEVITRYSPNEYEQEEKDGDVSHASVTDPPSRGVPGLYGVTYEGDSHRAPCPELGRDIVDGSALLEEGYDSDSSLNIGIEFINDLETWEENWLFSKRKVVPNPRAAAHHPVPVPMLVPCPAPDQTCRTLIGDVDAEETSDLSECSDSIYDDPIFESKTASLRVGSSSGSPSLRVVGSSETSSLRVGGSSSSDEDNTEAWLEARNERLLLSTPIDSGEGSLEVTEEDSSFPLPNDTTSSTSSRPVPKPRKNTVAQNKHQNSNGLRNKPPTGMANRKHSGDSVIKTSSKAKDSTASKAKDSTALTEKFLETERNAQQTVIEGEPNEKLSENSNHISDNTNSNPSQKMNGTIINKTVERVNETNGQVENKQMETVPAKSLAKESKSKNEQIIETEQLDNKTNDTTKESAALTNHNQKQNQNNSLDIKSTSAKDYTMVKDKLDGSLEEKTEQSNRNQNKLNNMETEAANSQEINATNGKLIEDNPSKETKNPKVKETAKSKNSALDEPVTNEQAKLSNTVNNKDNVTEQANKEIPTTVEDAIGENDVKKNKEVPMVMKDNTEAVKLSETDEVIAKESYDREHEAELGEIEILNTPPKPGTIAEREHAKWLQAVPLQNNPYSRENIEKRNRQRLFDLSRSASSDQTESNDETDHSRPESIIVTTTSSPDMIKRYSRDYYINNSCGTPSSLLSSSNTSLSSIGKVAHPVKLGDKSKGLPQSQKRGVRRSKDLDDLKRPPNVSSEESSDEYTSVLDRDSDIEDTKVLTNDEQVEVFEDNVNIRGTQTSETAIETNKDIVNNIKIVIYGVETSKDELKYDTSDTTHDVNTSFDSTLSKKYSTDTAEDKNEDKLNKEHYSHSMDDTGFSDIKTIQSTQNQSEDAENSEINAGDNCSVNATGTSQNNGVQNENSLSPRKNSIIEKSASHSDILDTKKNDIRYISAQTLPNQTIRDDGKPAKKKSKNIFSSLKKFLTKKKSKSISKCESSQSIWFADKSLQNIYSDTWNQKQHDQMKRESFDDELLDTFRKTKMAQIENFIKNEQAEQAFNNFDFLKNMSDTSSMEDNMLETVPEKTLEHPGKSITTPNFAKKNLEKPSVKTDLEGDAKTILQNVDINVHDDKNQTQENENTNTYVADDVKNITLESMSSNNLEGEIIEQNNKSNSSTLERSRNNNSQPIQVVLDRTEHPCGDIIVHVDSDNGIDDVESIEKLDINAGISPMLKRNNLIKSSETQAQSQGIPATSNETMSDELNKINDFTFASVGRDNNVHENKSYKNVEISDQERAAIIAEIDQIFEHEGLNITFNDSISSVDGASTSKDKSDGSIRLSNNFTLPQSLDRNILERKQEEIHEKNIQRNKATPVEQDFPDIKIGSSDVDYLKSNENGKANGTKNENSFTDSKLVDTDITEIGDKITDKFYMENIDMQKSFLIPADALVKSQSNGSIESFSDKLAGNLEEYVLRNSVHHKTLKAKHTPATDNFSVNPLFTLEQDGNGVNIISENSEQNNENANGINEARQTRASTPENSFLDADYSFYLRKTPESGYSSTVETARETTPDLSSELRRVSECEEMVVPNSYEMDDADVEKTTTCEGTETYKENTNDFDSTSTEKYNSKEKDYKNVGNESAKDNGKRLKHIDDDKSTEINKNKHHDKIQQTFKSNPSRDTKKSLLEPGIILDQRIVVERRNILSQRSPIPSPRAVRNKININKENDDQNNDVNLSQDKASVTQENVPNDFENMRLEDVTENRNREDISTEINISPVEPNNLGDQLYDEFVKLKNVFSKSVENLGDNLDSIDTTVDKTKIKVSTSEIPEAKANVGIETKRLSGPSIVPYDHLKELSNVRNCSNFNTRL